MTNFTQRESGNVKIIHHSTSSVIEIIIRIDKEVSQSKFERVTETVWLDYETFNNLKKLVYGL